MRTIKFRAKNLDGEWVYGFYVEEERQTINGFEKKYFIVNDGYDYVKPDTVGQFTGLYDKDGVEIYESDVVSVDFEGTEVVKTCTVEWSNHSASFVLTMLPGTGYGLFMDKEFVEKSVKVIGNMYQAKD